MPPASAHTRPTPVSFRSGQRLDGAAVWWVERGHVDVFLVDDAAGSRRHHVVRVARGEVVASVGAAFEGLDAGLQAVSGAGARVREAEAGDGVVGDALSQWVARLSSAAGTSPPDDTGAPVERPEANDSGDRHATYREVARRLVHSARQSARAEAGRLAERDERREQTLHEALRALGDVVVPDTGTPPVSAGGDLLLAAARITGDALGVEVVDAPEPPDGAVGTGDRLDAIARASGLRLRRVALRGDWWRHDNGPLLARTQPPDRDAGASSSLPSPRPLALLPDGRGGTVCVDPAAGTRIPVDARSAPDIHPFAYSFYRPFPDAPLSWLDVLRFGAAPCRNDLATILLVSAAAGLLSTAAPVVTGIIVNDVIPGADRPRLLEMTAALLVVVVVTACFQVTRSFALLRVQGRMEADVQAAVWDRLLKLPVAFFRRYTAGNVAQRAMSVSRIQRLLAGPALVSLLGGVFSVFHFALLFAYSPRLAVWAIGLSLGVLVLVVGGAAVQLRYQRRITDAANRLSGLVLQLLTGIAKLRVAGAEAAAFAQWASLFAEQRRLQFQSRRLAYAVSTAVRVTPLLVTLTVFALAAPTEAASAVLDAAISPTPTTGMRTGDLLAFLAALTAGLTALLATRSAVTQVFSAIPLYENAQPILHARPETPSGQTAPGRLSGRVELSRVSFRYDADGPPVIDDVSLSIAPGSFVALVGPSGSGKSTLLRLLLGFETPDSGTVAYDDRDLAGLDVRAVRRQIGVVLQDGALMPGDVRSNILGSSRASTDAVWAAAEQAGLADDVRAMPMGLHTVVGSGASTLSGGQIQRLLIARAIVHRPRLLFFDEATSALDNRTQAQVSRSLHRLRATRVVVAHRLSTIRHADCIYVLDRGRVVESGSFDALSTGGGLFQSLAARQTLE